MQKKFTSCFFGPYIKILLFSTSYRLPTISHSV